jgi:hypothetical protein
MDLMLGGRIIIGGASSLAPTVVMALYCIIMTLILRGKWVDNNDAFQHSSVGRTYFAVVGRERDLFQDTASRNFWEDVLPIN